MSHHQHKYTCQSQQSAFNPITGGGMIAGSVSAGLLFALLSPARRYHQEPLKQSAMLAAGGAAVSVG
jgi:hypothetical protein